MRVLLIGAGAAVVALAVWLSVAADAMALASDAGWWALVALAFPLLMFGLYVRDWIHRP